MKSGPMKAAYQAAMQQPPPAAANGFRSRTAIELVSLSAELQRLAGDEPFFLAQTAAADLIGVGQQTVSYWMIELRDQGIVRREGTARPRHASEYRYLGATA